MKRCVACGRAVEDSSGIVEHASCPWCGGGLRDDPAGFERSDVGDATVSGVDPTYAFTVRPIEPEPGVECDGRVLARNRDHLVQYRNYTGVGSENMQASVTVGVLKDGTVVATGATNTASATWPIDDAD